MNILIKSLAALGLAATIALQAGQSQATVFAAWQVANVAWGDTLNVRKYPANSSETSGLPQRHGAADDRPLHR